MKPTYTIAIPVYERIFGFEEALQSAMSVDGCSEILVVDDMSKHNEFELICSAKNDDRIRYVRNDKNVGLFGNWNRCAELASGEFISILCSDDLVEPDVYTRFLKVFNQSPDIDVFFGSFAIFTTTIEKAQIVKSYKSGPVGGKELLEDATDNGASFPILSVIRRNKILEYPFVAKPHSGNDWLWIFSNTLSLNLYSDSKPLSYWRMHENQDLRNSSSVVGDCWPLMYSEISSQLRICKSRKVTKAQRRAEGVILTWLLNDKSDQDHWTKRLLGDEVVTNPFLKKARNVVDNNWLLSKMLKSTNLSRRLYYNVGRAARKLGIYPAPF